MSHRPKLLDQVRVALRTRHYSPLTEKAYLGWIRRYIRFQEMRHPMEMGAAEIAEFLPDLAVVRRVSASTQNPALSALLFLYREVLDSHPGSVDGVVRGKGQADDLAPAAEATLKRHLWGARDQFDLDLKAGRGSVELPFGLNRKYPKAHREWGWHWVFPATRFYRDRTGSKKRHHVHQTVIQRAVREATLRAGLTKPATCHVLRHSFAFAFGRSGRSFTKTIVARSGWVAWSREGNAISGQFSIYTALSRSISPAILVGPSGY